MFLFSNYDNIEKVKINGTLVFNNLSDDIKILLTMDLKMYQECLLII